MSDIPAGDGKTANLFYSVEQADRSSRIASYTAEDVGTIIKLSCFLFFDFT